MSLDLNGEAVNDCAELAPQPDVPAFGADVVDDAVDGFAATHTSFVPTLVHFSVVLPDLAVRPDFAHLPPGVFAAFTSKAETPRSVAATVRTIETLTTLR